MRADSQFVKQRVSHGPKSQHDVGLVSLVKGYETAEKATPLHVRSRIVTEGAQTFRAFSANDLLEALSDDPRARPGQLCP